MAVNTVARAYRELESAGILETRGRFGTFVARTDPADAAMATAAHTYATAAQVARRRQGRGAEVRRSGVRLAAELEQGETGRTESSSGTRCSRPHQPVEHFAAGRHHRQIMHGADAGMVLARFAISDGDSVNGIGGTR